MDAAGELNWDIEPYNGKNCFFSRESYDKYSMDPSFEELLQLCNKPATAEPVPCSSGAQESPIPVAESQDPVAPTPTKSVPPFPQPRVQYPRYSLLTASEQETYVKLMIKFINSTETSINVLQIKEHNHYEFLKMKSTSEHMEFQKFLQNAARNCPEDYNVLSADANRYIPKMIKCCQGYVKNYPELYAVHSITSMLGGKFIPDLSLNLEKCLLKMGKAHFVKVKFPTDDILLPTSYNKISHAIPPAKKAGRLHKNVTSDPNISKLVSKYCPQVVLTEQALFTLLNNHGLEYNEQWEIPVRVKTVNDVVGTSSKVVYVDSPLPKKVLSFREKSQMFHEVVLDQFMLKNSLVFLQAVSMDQKEREWRANVEFSHRKLAGDRVEVSFENDVTELEIFGTSEADRSGTARSDDKSPGLPQASNNSLLDTMRLEKKLITNSNPVKHGVDLEEVEQKSEIPKSCTSAIRLQSPGRNESETDSDEEKLVIDCKNREELNTSTQSETTTTSTVGETTITSTVGEATASSTVSEATTTSTVCETTTTSTVGEITTTSTVSEATTSAVGEITTTSSPAPTLHQASKRTGKKISKDADTLGQILKMQTQLLKPGSKKSEQARTLNPEKDEQLSQNPMHFQPAASLISDSSQETQRKDSAIPLKDTKALLSNDLLNLSEDDTDYTLDKDENLVYKLFSLDDMLLLLQCTIHTVLTSRKRNVDKVSKKQVPVFVLTKMDYQYCYGVESLTESESCRLWTEHLVHSNCTLYVGHVDAFTSKFFMLEEVPAPKLKEKISIFKPVNCLNTLRHILKWLTGLQDGSYLLSHTSKDASIYLYKSVTDEKGTYNLHEAHSNPPEAPSSLSVPWVPLNPNLLLSYHIQHGRPPCTFPPAPATNPGNPKINQPRTPPRHENATNPPNSNLVNTKQTPKKGRNRLHRLKAKQKMWKAQASKHADT